MNRTLSTTLTIAAVAGCVLVGGAAMANVISIDDTAGRAQPVEPVQVSPSPSAPPVATDPAPVLVPPTEPAPSAPQTVSPPAPRDVSRHDGPAHHTGAPGEGDDRLGDNDHDWGGFDERDDDSGWGGHSGRDEDDGRG